jgi:dTDP-4-amino-4,6-dideoxygalactose transaminase
MDIRFTDCDPNTWVMGPDNIEGEPEVIIGVHISGVPCDVRSLEARARKLGSALVFDAAHGAGSLIDDQGRLRPLGSFGLAEVFSLTPTKVLSGAEGGLVTTNDDELASTIRRARNYGNPGSYDTLEPGLNGRMSEFHAAIVLSGLDHLEDRVATRNTLAAGYRERLGHLPGIGFQTVPAGRRSSMKDFTIVVSSEFGLARDHVVRALVAEGIPTRPYYSPPVHRQTAYSDVTGPALPNTDALAAGVVSLPIWSHMTIELVDRISDAISRIHHHRREISAAIGE